jgi:glycosyltransferase involved in cell wall biosynthesis
VAKKGLEVLRNAALRQPNFTWAFAGAGPLDPRKWNIDNVRVYSELRGRGLAELYRASDVFVLPSTGEGFPLVIQEALACGLPVVCSAENATADSALAPFVRGVPLTAGDDPRSAEDLLSAMGDVLSEGLTPEGSQHRYRFAQTRYSWQRAVTQYQSVLEDLVVQLGHDAPTIICRNSIDE